MFEINKAGESTYYIRFPTALGIYKLNDTEVCFIDSTSDSGMAKRALKHITEMGWNLMAIYCTHAHADHVGGCAYLQRQTGCKVYCPAIDLGAVQNGILNPIMLYGGYPPKELFSKFHFAEDCDAEALREEILPEGLEVFPLFGHTLGMVGYKTKDEVYFLADSVSSKETLDRYLATYNTSIPKFLKTLDYIETLRGNLFIPSHAEPTKDMGELLEINRKSVYDMMKKVLEICKTPHSSEELTKKVFELNTVSFTIAQHSLVNSTLKAYTSFLMSEGKLEPVLEDNEFKFKTR